MTDVAARPRRSGRAILLIKVAISGLLLAVLFWRADRTALVQSLGSLPFPVFLACAVLYILGSVISTVRWWLLLRAEGIRIPVWRLSLVYFQGAFFSLFLPTLIGGDIVRGVFIHRMTGGHDASVASILVDRLSGFAALMTIALVALLVPSGMLGDSQVAAMIVAIAALFAGLMAVLVNERLMDRASGLLRLVGLERFQAKLQGMMDALHRYRKHHRALAQAFLLSVLLQVLIIVTYYFIGVGLNLGAPLVYFFLFVPLITVLAMLPVSIAGLGVRESGVVYFFAKVGVGAGAALGMSLVWFSLTVVVSGLGGLAFLLDTHAAKRTGD
jgi:glycosyltransferase 2 family protein